MRKENERLQDENKHLLRIIEEGKQKSLNDDKLIKDKNEEIKDKNEEIKGYKDFIRLLLKNKEN